MASETKSAPKSVFFFKSVSSKTICDFNFRLDTAFHISVSWDFEALCSSLPLCLLQSGLQSPLFLCSTSDLDAPWNHLVFSFHLHPTAFTPSLHTANTPRPELPPCLYFIRLSILLISIDFLTCLDSTVYYFSHTVINTLISTTLWSGAVQALQVVYPTTAWWLILTLTPKLWSTAEGKHLSWLLGWW